MTNPIIYLLERLKKPKHEPEYEEAVEHDTVMLMRDGRLTEVTEHDPEIREQR